MYSDTANFKRTRRRPHALGRMHAPRGTLPWTSTHGGLFPFYCALSILRPLMLHRRARHSSRSWRPATAKPRYWYWYWSIDAKENSSAMRHRLQSSICSAGAAGMYVIVTGPPCGHLAGISLYLPLRCQYSSLSVHCTVALHIDQLACSPLRLM